MRLSILLSIVPVFIGLQACCSPNACRYAKSGAAALAPTLAEIEKYKERNGKYPVTFDDIRKGYGPEAEKQLPRELLTDLWPSSG